MPNQSEGLVDMLLHRTGSATLEHPPHRGRVLAEASAADDVASSSESGDDECRVEEAGAPHHHRGRMKRVMREAKRVLEIALPISLVDSASFVASLVGVAEVGRLGYKELSALTLGNTFYNLTGLSIIVGMTTGMDGIGGQVFGAGQYGALGVLLQRASLACSLVCLPIYAMWTQTPRILQLLGQDPVVSKMATQYVWICSPCLLLSTTRMCIRSYFSAQGVVFPLTVLTAYSTVMSPVFNYYFITWLELGLEGAAIAYVAEDVTGLLLCIAMVVWLHCRQDPDERTWPGFSTESLRGWGLYFQVAVPSMVMVCLDWWVLEVMVLLSGLGSASGVQVAAMGLLFNAFTFIYYVCDGFGSAASTRVSNELGACNSRGAKLACTVAISMGLMACLVWCAILYATYTWWLRIFTNEASVIQMFGQCMPFVCAAVVGYSTNTIVSGVLRGTARSEVGLWINFVSLWLVGLPLAAVLALYYDMGPMGLWIGVATMNLLQGGLLAVSVSRFDWQVEMHRSQTFVSLCTTPPASDLYQQDADLFLDPEMAYRPLDGEAAPSPPSSSKKANGTLAVGGGYQDGPSWGDGAEAAPLAFPEVSAESSEARRQREISFFGCECPADEAFAQGADGGNGALPVEVAGSSDAGSEISFRAAVASTAWEEGQVPASASVAAAATVSGSPTPSAWLAGIGGESLFLTEAGGLATQDGSPTGGSQGSGAPAVAPGTTLDGAAGKERL